MSKKFIVFEGVDGAGKTICIKRAIEKLKGNHKIIYNKGIGSKTFIGKIARQFHTTFLFLLEMFFVTLKILKPYWQGKIIFQDRYIFSVASHLPDINKKYNRFLIKIFNPFFLKPSLVIYFTVSLKERLNRLQESASNNPFHQILIDNPNLILEREKKFYELLQPYKNKTIIIDTTNKTIEESTDEVSQALDKFFKRSIMKRISKQDLYKTWKGGTSKMPTETVEVEKGKVEIIKDEDKGKPETKTGGVLKPPEKKPPIGIDTIPPKKGGDDEPIKEGGKGD